MQACRLLCCGILYLLILSSNGVFPVISMSGDQSVEDGDNVALVCIVRNPSVPVEWVKLPNGSLPAQTSRISVTRAGESQQISSILRLRNVSWTDTGTYQCQQTLSTFRFVVSSFRVYVSCKDEFDFYLSNSPVGAGTASSRLVASLGKHVQLFCNATGFTDANVSWRKGADKYGENEELLIPGRYLNICNVQRWNQGTYSCEAGEDIGQMSRRDVILLVEYEPTITLPSGVVSQAVNYTSELRCIVEGFPTPDVTWLKEDVDLHNDTKYYVSQFVTEESEIWSTLTVLATELEDFGNYTCLATNKLGFTIATIDLRESPFPVLPRATRMEPSNKVPASDPSDESGVNPNFNVTGFILGMMPPLWISFYIILHLGFRSRYAEERPEEEGGDGVDEIVWEQGLKVAPI